jgi:hypothetical protein
MTSNSNKDSISRLAVAFLEQFPELERKHGDKVLEEIDRMLNALSLRIICTDQIQSSISQQAALVTVINAAKRCFKGGVFIEMPLNITCKLTWPNSKYLKDIVIALGGYLDSKIKTTVTIRIGPSLEAQDWHLLVDNWRAVLVPPGFKCPELTSQQTFPLGGILGAGLIVGQLFLKFARFDLSIGRQIVGWSLWEPTIAWDHPDAVGPEPCTFPKKLWLVGLGHLGQSYAWSLGLLPLLSPEELLIQLQDDDRIVPGNLDAGLLADNNIGNFKTRVVAEWLESRGITTRIIERKYDSQTARKKDDPLILLGGLDNVEARKSLRSEDFQLLIDCGLGGNLDFDLIHLNVFPNIGNKPKELWEHATPLKEINPRFNQFTNKYLTCGFTVGIASAFSGCVSASIAISEILRSCHFGTKLSSGVLSIRELQDLRMTKIGQYGCEINVELISFNPSK